MNAFQQYLLDEFVEDYRDGRMSRREFVMKVIGVAGGLAVGGVSTRGGWRPRLFWGGRDARQRRPGPRAALLAGPTIAGLVINGLTLGDLDIF